jgi:nitroreductase
MSAVELNALLRSRRSIRTYTGADVPEAALAEILEAGLLGPSGRNLRPWEFIVVRRRETLDALAACRTGAADMLRGARCAVAVIADGDKSDTWIEDCAVAMAYMHLCAASLGVGSCWIQGRDRAGADGRPAEETAREVLGFPRNYRLEAILSLGMPDHIPAGRDPEKLKPVKLHEERFTPAAADEKEMR